MKKRKGRDLSGVESGQLSLFECQCPQCAMWSKVRQPAKPPPLKYPQPDHSHHLIFIYGLLHQLICSILSLHLSVICIFSVSLSLSERNLIYRSDISHWEADQPLLKLSTHTFKYNNADGE